MTSFGKDTNFSDEPCLQKVRLLEKTLGEYRVHKFQPD